MTIAAALLLTLVFGLLVFDWSTLRGRNRRALWLQSVAFAGAAFFIVFPERANALAHGAGIGRGVDFLLYPIVIWLVRESLLSRSRRLEDAERLTQVVRTLAILEARNLQSPAGASTTVAKRLDEGVRSSRYTPRKTGETGECVRRGIRWPHGGPEG